MVHFLDRFDGLEEKIYYLFMFVLCNQLKSMFGVVEKLRDNLRITQLNVGAKVNLFKCL